MRISGKAAAIVFAVCAATVPGAQAEVSDADAAKAVDGLVTGYVRPSFDSFAAAASQLAVDADTLCRAPGNSELQAARDGFRQAALAFGKIEFLRLGPLVQENRLERLLFWPDRRGIALRQVQAAIGDKDPDVTNSATLGKKSVALQGFTALEFLLFGTGSDALGENGAGHRCGFASAIAANIDDIASQMSAEWNDPAGIARTWSRPGPENERFRNGEEVLSELVSLPADGLEILRDQRLLPIVPAGEAPKPKRALFWRSGLTFPMVASEIDGMKNYFIASSLAALLPAEANWMTGSTLFEFQNAAKTIRKLTMPVDVAVNDAGSVKEIRYLSIVTRSLFQLVGGQIATALGLSTGFSTLDGD